VCKQFVRRVCQPPQEHQHVHLHPHCEQEVLNNNVVLPCQMRINEGESLNLRTPDVGAQPHCVPYSDMSSLVVLLMLVSPPEGGAARRSFYTCLPFTKARSRCRPYSDDEPITFMNSS